MERSELRARRDVVSFVRRSNRMRPNQRRAWEAYRDRFVLEVPRLDTSTSVHPAASLDLEKAFGRDAELIVEIGPGTGESLVPMAKARPQANVLAFNRADARSARKERPGQCSDRRGGRRGRYGVSGASPIGQ